MNSRQRILTTLDLQIPDRVPIFENSIASNVIKSVIGENNLLKFIEVVGLDGVTITINYKRKMQTESTYIDEFEVLRKIDKTYDMPLSYPIKTISDLREYKWPNVKEEEKYKNIVEAAEYFN